MAEAVLQDLTKKVGLGKSHSMSVSAIKKAPKDRGFATVLLNDPEISKILSDPDVKRAQTLKTTTAIRRHWWRKSSRLPELTAKIKRSPLIFKVHRPTKWLGVVPWAALHFCSQVPEPRLEILLSIIQEGGLGH